MEESNREQNLISLMKRSLQLIIPFSIFYMCLRVPIPSMSPFFTEFCWLLSQTLERKYMFLICNGILAFLAKKSRFSSSGSDFAQLPGVDTTADHVEEVISPSFEALEDDIVLVHEDNEEVKKEESALLRLSSPPPKEVEEKEEETKYISVLEGEVSIEKDIASQEKKEEEEEGFTVKQEEDDYGGEPPSMEANEEFVISTEELNRKIEEFIRKMKEEIRIEAQQQLIAV